MFEILIVMIVGISSYMFIPAICTVDNTSSTHAVYSHSFLKKYDLLIIKL